LTWRIRRADGPAASPCVPVRARHRLGAVGEGDEQPEERGEVRRLASRHAGQYESSEIMRNQRSPARKSRFACTLALAAIVAWAFAARVGSVAGPFGFGWQFLGAFYSKMARNVVEYGPLHARFAMIENALPATPDHWVVYTHHPPGMALATAVLPAGAYFS